MPKRSQSLLVLVLILLVVIVVTIVFRTHLREIDRSLMQIGWLGPIALIGLYGLLCLTPIPTDPITLLVGALYGPLLGLLISWFGNTFASLVEYYVSHHIGNLTRFDVLKQKLPWGLAKVPVNSIWFLTFGRMVPGYGGKLVSVLGGLYHVPFRRYLWTTLITNFFGSVLWVIAGHFLARL